MSYHIFDQKSPWGLLGGDLKISHFFGLNFFAKLVSPQRQCVEVITLSLIPKCSPEQDGSFFLKKIWFSEIFGQNAAFYVKITFCGQTVSASSSIFKVETILKTIGPEKDFKPISRVVFCRRPNEKFFWRFLTVQVAVLGTLSNLAESCLQKTHIFLKSYDILPSLKFQKYPWKIFFYIGNNSDFALLGTKLLFEAF